MRARVLTEINEVSATDWNHMVPDNNPFSKHEFLSSLEINGCLGEKFGWIPRHIVVESDGKLLGAAILYEKHNNYGEFVFDHAWHQAYDRYGLDYYPKLVSAIPYTPASGVRLLSKSKDINKVYPLLLQSIEDLCRDIGASSYHCLFSNSRDIEWLSLEGLCLRHDCQFHWRNDGYNDFDDFLQTLKSKKRKNIRRERRLVSDSGVYLRLLNGHNATHIDWKNFNNFYQRTFLEKSGMPTLNLSFFEDIAKKIPDQIVLILADLDGKCVAGSLMFSSDTRLYGRHWGCIEHIDNLHFEACYYKGIDYCIENKLDVFEPGAQGEHKVSRGFLPTLTRSAHLIIDDNFKEPISSFCEQEQQYIEQYIQEISSHSPYKGKATC